MMILAVDAGTTHCKAGLFTPGGKAYKTASRPMSFLRAAPGFRYIEPEDLWSLVIDVVREVTQGNREEIRATGITGMGEGGLLVDRQSGMPRTAIIPWFDNTSQPQADRIAEQIPAMEGYRKFGMRTSYKCALARLLWLKEHFSESLPGSIWLDVPAYISFRMCGQANTDYSLASRTYAFLLKEKEWDHAWLESFGLDPEIFPPAQIAGSPAGNLQAGAAAALGIEPGTPVSVCGHDHICAAVGAGAIETGTVFDSMGTAETLTGAFAERPLTEKDFQTGLNCGLHTAKGSAYWLGGISTSGGSLEWARSLLDGQTISYQEVDALLAAAPDGPTGIIYYPYLLGSGSPHTDPLARAAFVGLTASSTRAEVLKSVLEGTAFELEFIRRAGERMNRAPVTSLLAAGGGTRNRHWLQIKADVLGIPIIVQEQPEAALLGAALLAGAGAGVYRDLPEALKMTRAGCGQTIAPDTGRHSEYMELYENGYLRLMRALRDFDDQFQGRQPA